MGGDASLLSETKYIKQIREENPGGPYKKIAREKFGLLSNVFEKVSLVTGGFDPIHSGHISYFKRAKDFSDYLVVGLNTNEWLTAKKGQYFSILG